MEDQIWNESLFIKTPQNVKDFYEEYAKLCKKHGMSISHEDTHGAFIIEEGNPEDNLEQMQNAHFYRLPKDPKIIFPDPKKFY